MDMNLNISAQLSTNFKSNMSETKQLNKINDFDSLIKELDLDNEIDCNDEIALAMIQNIINFINNREIDNKLDLNIDKESFENITEQIVNISKVNDEDNNLKLKDFKVLDSSTLEHLKILDNSNVIDSLEKIYSYNKKDSHYDENLVGITKKIDVEENIEFRNFIKVNVENLISEKNEYVGTNSILDQGIDECIDNEGNKYNELEYINASNKFSILSNMNTEYTEIDKDIEILENIIELTDNKSIILQPIQSNIDKNINNEVIDTPIMEIKSDNFTHDFIKTVKYLSSNGVEEIKIKVSPKELGDMTIKLIKNSDEFTISISLSKEESFDLVNKNISEITKHLNELNIKVNEINIDINKENLGSFSDLQQEFENSKHQNKKKSNKNISHKNEKIEELIELELDDNLNILI